MNIVRPTANNFKEKGRIYFLGFAFKTPAPEAMATFQQAGAIEKPLYNYMRSLAFR